MTDDKIPLPTKQPDGAYKLSEVYTFIDAMRQRGKQDSQIAFLLGVETHRLVFFDKQRGNK